MGEGELFQRWIREHVGPRTEALKALRPDDYLAFLPQAISPFVYWARENQSPSPGGVSSPTSTTQPASRASLPTGDLGQLPGMERGEFVRNGEPWEFVRTAYLQSDQWKDLARRLPGWTWSREERQFERKKIGAI